MPKEPRIAISFRLTFKNPPPGWRGIKSESWGTKDKPLLLKNAIVGLARRLIIFYTNCDTYTLSDYNRIIQETADEILKFKLEDKLDGI